MDVMDHQMTPTLVTRTIAQHGNHGLNGPIVLFHVAVESEKFDVNVKTATSARRGASVTNENWNHALKTHALNGPSGTNGAVAIKSVAPENPLDTAIA